MGRSVTSPAAIFEAIRGLSTRMGMARIEYHSTALRGRGTYGVRKKGTGAGRAYTIASWCSLSSLDRDHTNLNNNDQNGAKWRQMAQIPGFSRTLETVPEIEIPGFSLCRSVIRPRTHRLKSEAPTFSPVTRDCPAGRLLWPMPYWLLAYESLISMFVDRSDQNAPNQTMLMSRTITESKRQFLVTGNQRRVVCYFHRQSAGVPCWRHSPRFSTCTRPARGSGRTSRAVAGSREKASYRINL